METGTFGILILSGLCNLAFSSRQYHYVSTAKTWLDAQKYCRMKYKDLVPISNEQDMAKLSEVSGGATVFVGLYRNWSWSLSDTDDYKVGEEAYWKWTSGQPAIGDCGAIDGLTGEWSAIDCDTKLNFTCYNSFDGFNAEIITLNQLMSFAAEATTIPQRFTLIKTPKTWRDAQAYCRAHYTDLARVRDQLENDEVQMMVKNGSVWIGLTRMTWMWSDGSEASFIPWKPEQPETSGVYDCGVLVSIDPVALVDVSCSGTRTFLCYSEPVTKRLMRLKLSADGVDMADPAVHNSIMNWVITKLGDAGTTTEFKVTWWKLPELEILEEEITIAPQTEASCLR